MKLGWHYYIMHQVTCGKLELYDVKSALKEAVAILVEC
jgi:hypothetical protein